MHLEPCTIRRAEPGDCAHLVEMMRELAAFEGYLDDFRVTARELEARAFGPAPQCAVLVAQGPGGALAGYAVYLVTPFTYDLRPGVTLKELYVARDYRQQGVAAALLARLRQEACDLGAGRIRWLVLPSNDQAKRLYRRFGGAPDTAWEHWQLALPA